MQDYSWLLLILLLTKSAYSLLYCFEGTNCEKNDSCDRCEGSACVRVVRASRQSFHYISSPQTTRSTNLFERLIRRDPDIDFYGPNAQVALTCLPDGFNVESEGCRTDTVNQLRTCICSKDYCNGDERFYGLFFTTFLGLLGNLA